jgi:predicted deacylase
MTTYASIKDVPQQPGRYLVRLPVTVDMNGMDIVVWTHVFAGAKPGPTLTVLSGLHGNEWLSIEFFRRLAAEIDPAALAGSVRMIPMANAAAFGQLQRSVPDDSDNNDANRSFPGRGRRFTWIAEQLATTIADEVLASSHALVDFHSGIWGSTMGQSIVGTDYSNPEVSKKSLDLSLAFGNPLIFAAKMVTAWPGPRSSQGYSGEVLGIPCCGSMLGGAGFDRDQEDAWLGMNHQGVRNVMIHLGMIGGRMALPERYLLYETVQRVNPRTGGYLDPVNRVEAFGREVRAGELLGRVVSPFTFEVLEELVSPIEGWLGYWARNYPVRPGDWAYGVIPKDHPSTRWVPRPNW